MAVCRVEKTKDYTVMSNSHLKSKSLTLKAKGLLSIMLSLPEEWDYTVAGLAALSADGLDSVRTALKELEANGYLHRSQTKCKGKFDKSEYIVYERPQGEKPLTENPLTENPMTEKPMQLNTNISNTKISNTEKKERKKAAGSFDEIIADYTSSEDLKRALYEYIKMRKLIKKPLTDYALKRQLKTLDGLAKTDAEKVAVVDQSVTRNWLGLFPLNSDYKKPQPAARPPQQETEEERLRREQSEQLLALFEGRN